MAVQVAGHIPVTLEKLGAGRRLRVRLAPLASCPSRSGNSSLSPPVAPAWHAQLVVHHKVDTRATGVTPGIL